MKYLLVAALVAGCAARPAPPRRPALVAPEIIVSLEGLTVHLFDRTTGASFVYRAIAGKRNAYQQSVTPVGHFATGADVGDRWWYMPRRVEPEQFGGMPFLRLTAQNRRGEHVYGLHGPVVDGGDATDGYASRGCVRLAAEDIRALYEMIREHPSTPVTIQQEIELDAEGEPITPGAEPALWPALVPIPYGDSVGPRPD